MPNKISIQLDPAGTERQVLAAIQDLRDKLLPFMSGPALPSNVSSADRRWSRTRGTGASSISYFMAYARSIARSVDGRSSDARRSS